MLNHTSFSELLTINRWGSDRKTQWWQTLTSPGPWQIGIVSLLLVSVPVFFQAPLVRQFPILSLLLTLGWVALGYVWRSQKQTELWGDLILGFSWSWLAGSIYWGWLRWEPLFHLPVEAIGVPFVLISLWRRSGSVGNLFYLGSLFGTAVTDIYFYLVNLIPHWRQLMQVEPELDLIRPIFKSAIAQIQTPWGLSWAIALIVILLVAGLLPLRSKKSYWWAFGGAVLSTILVDSLFWVAARSAV
ncbi:MAG: DUF3120 domain-containing protein [Desertifilum sp. SIO1I2]|nr:DUF3120 domain-containing protein [Desertifilum sp. SIO1I2]